MTGLHFNVTQLPRWLRQLGWPGLLGLLALAACVWQVQWALPQRRAEVAQTESDTRRMRHELLAKSQVATSAASAPPRDEPRQAWARLWASLPDEQQRLALQGRVLASAEQVGVSLPSVQWQGEAVRWASPGAAPAATPTAGLWRQRMAMPVQTSYPALRSWLDRLQREPALSVDAIDIQRNDLGSDQVRAQVSVSLWWRLSGRDHSSDHHSDHRSGTGQDITKGAP